MPEIRVYIAQSLDGFITTADGGVDWLEAFNDVDYGYDDFLAEIGTIVMGRATYDQVRGFGAWPYPDHPTWVVTSRRLADAPDGVAAWHEDLGDLVTRLRDGAHDVWLLGGAETIAGFLDLGAVDRLELFVMPVVLGDGIRLFGPSTAAPDLVCATARRYDNGVARLDYEVAALPSKPSPTR